MTEEFPLFVQTDFTELSKWEALLSEASKENEMGMRAYFEAISEARFNGAAPQEVAGAFPGVVVVFIVDAEASQSGNILCMDGENPLASFRAKPEDLWMVENNLTAGNLLFEELIEQVGEDGVLVGLEM